MLVTGYAPNDSTQRAIVVACLLLVTENSAVPLDAHSD